jgi:hypothetical protein
MSHNIAFAAWIAQNNIAAIILSPTTVANPINFYSRLNDYKPHTAPFSPAALIAIA